MKPLFAAVFEAMLEKVWIAPIYKACHAICIGWIAYIAYNVCQEFGISFLSCIGNPIPTGQIFEVLCI